MPITFYFQGILLKDNSPLEHVKNLIAAFLHPFIFV